jgi:hypothetical protein
MQISGTSYDSEGNVIKCDKCYKQAGYHVQGYDFQINYCKDHSPYAGMQEAKFVYRPSQEAFEAGKKAYEQDNSQFIYKPPIYDGPLAVDVKVGYRFHEARVCRDCIYIRTAPKARKKLLYRSGVGCRGYDARITNDLWFINLRGPDWKPRRVIKFKKK